ncbi:MAG: phosphate propanoyltransferase [Gemmatimonadota bacterium]|nr:phosphate propanoyltransferase [Gemmatimonadota bacterium]
MSTIDEKLVRKIVSRVVQKHLQATGEDSSAGQGEAASSGTAGQQTAQPQAPPAPAGLRCETIPVGVSSRHAHVTREDFEKLFGPGRELMVLRPLSQPGQFAAQETVAVVTDRGRIDKLRLLGPFRPQTQVELSHTDARRLGISPPVRGSGKLTGSTGARLEGPAGRVDIGEGVIVAERHIHITPKDAERLGVADSQYVDVHTAGERELVFRRVLVRVGDQAAADFHLDTDEANASGLTTGDLVHVCVPVKPVAKDKPSGRRVITEQMIRDSLDAGEPLDIAGDSILTPAARDLALEKGLIKR